LASDEGLGTEREINSAPDQPTLFFGPFCCQAKKKDHLKAVFAEFDQLSCG
jgi:hypothetical protein